MKSLVLFFLAAACATQPVVTDRAVAEEDSRIKTTEYMKCALQEGRKLSITSKEAPQDIAIASHSACSMQFNEVTQARQAFYSTYQQNNSYRAYQMATNDSDGLKKDVSEAIVEIVVKKRSEKDAQKK